MTVYTPQRRLLTTGFDELGIRMNIPRLPNEPLNVYRRRLLLETRQMSGASTKQFFHSVSRKVGLFDDVVATIDIVDPDVPDPRLQITPAKFILWSDYENDTKVVELELNELDGYFLTDLEAAVNATSEFSWSWEVTSQEYVRSNKLLVTDNLHHDNFVNLPDNFVWNLGRNFVGVPRQIWATDPVVFDTEVAAGDLISADGEFALERDTDGQIIITTAVPMRGGLNLEWTEWPWRLRLAGVKVFAYNDSDTDYLFKDKAIDDETGLPVPKHLNDLGAEVANDVLSASPIEWGD